MHYLTEHSDIFFLPSRTVNLIGGLTAVDVCIQTGGWLQLQLGPVHSRRDTNSDLLPSPSPDEDISGRIAGCHITPQCGQITVIHVTGGDGQLYVWGDLGINNVSNKLLSQQVYVLQCFHFL